MTALHGTAVLGLVPLPTILHLQSSAGEWREGGRPLSGWAGAIPRGFRLPWRSHAAETPQIDHQRDASVQ
jgi:hypothetical protein